MSARTAGAIRHRRTASTATARGSDTLRRLIAPCAIHIPVPKIPAHVTVIRGGRRLKAPPVRHGDKTKTRGLFLQRGDEIWVVRPGKFTFSYADGNRFRIRHGRVRLDCRNVLLDSGTFPPRATVLAVDLRAGLVDVRAGGLARRALVLNHEMLALATIPGTKLEVDRNPAARRTRAWTLDKPIFAAQASHQTLRIRSRITYTAISDANGLRLDVWPFSISRKQRVRTRADRLVSFWNDGQQCSVGCRAPGAIPGWPIKPFHRQHAIRAGLNELRPANFHVAVDIDAKDFQPVYAIQSGVVHVRYPGTPDENVNVGQFDYWHVDSKVSDGQYVGAYRTELGTVKYGFKHIAFSEIGPRGQYLNPLRPGGSLSPYTDTEVPIIRVPRVFADGRVTVGAFDPQSFVDVHASYETPVLAPAALAWRLLDSRGHDRTGLQWALRGSQYYPPGLKPVIFAPGASNPGFNCFFRKRICIPNWVYVLAGGLTERLPLGSLPRGRYRLAVYAWGWAGGTSALERWITIPLANAASAPVGPLAPNFDYP